MNGPRLAPPVTERDHQQGDETALVTLIEYGDFECPHCRAAYPVLKRVKQRLGAGLRFVYRCFPLDEIHPHAQHAAEAAESVAARGGQEAFWRMHDMMFENQRRLDAESLGRYATAAGVPGPEVLGDLARRIYRDVVRESFMGGVRSGVNGTPTLFIDGVRYDGPRDEESLVALLGVVATEAHAG